MSAVIERVASDAADDDGSKRCQIIEGARQVFMAQGFDAASMGEIARAAGVSKGTLYVYFKDKEELFEAIVGQQCRAQAEQIFNLDDGGLRQRIAKALGDKADKVAHVLDVYRKGRPKASPTDLYIAITTGMGMWANAITLAERKVEQNGAPVFMYMFAYESEMPVAKTINYPMKSPHAMEIVFKFNHPENSANAGNRPERFQAARNMSQAWATFARSGDPSFGGIPRWLAYTLQTRATMILDASCRVVNDPFSAERRLWKEIAT